MAKSQLFKAPMDFIYTHGGVFPVRRGARDEEMFITAETILAKGGAITMYCEGGRSRTGKVAERPSAGSGAWRWRRARRWCRSRSTAPRACATGSGLQFPKVTVQYGDALRWERVENPTREQQQAVADEVLGEIRRLYAGLEEHGRKGILQAVRAQRQPSGAPPRGPGLSA